MQYAAPGYVKTAKATVAVERLSSTINHDTSKF